MQLAIATIQNMLAHERDPERKLLLLDALESLQRYEILVLRIEEEVICD